MGKKILRCLMVFSVIISGVGVLQAVDGKPKIKFAGVDASKLKVAKVERLTYDANKTEYKSYMYPKWSPDGKMIAFTSSPGFEGAEFKQKFKCLWVMNTDGSNKRKLTDEEGIGYNLEWTPDSKSIVYKVGNSIKEIEVETKKSFVVISAKKSISSIIKHPSGEIISVVDEDVMQIDKNIMNGRLKASPVKKSETNDKKVVYSLNSQLWSADADGKNKVLLLKRSDSDKYTIANAILSPTGKKVCCIKRNTTRVGYVIDIDGKNSISIGSTFPYTPSWSPDGSKILYASVRQEEATRIGWEIKPIGGGGVMEADLIIEDINEDKWKRLTNTKEEGEISPNWSPDGERILYVSGKNGDIYVITIGIME